MLTRLNLAFVYKIFSTGISALCIKVYNVCSQVCVCDVMTGQQMFADDANIVLHAIEPALSTRVLAITIIVLPSARRIC
jgi:hypothetical protein